MMQQWEHIQISEYNKFEARIKKELQCPSFDFAGECFKGFLNNFIVSN